jgi:hypothetical protein
MKDANTGKVAVNERAEIRLLAHPLPVRTVPRYRTCTLRSEGQTYSEKGADAPFFLIKEIYILHTILYIVMILHAGRSPSKK